MLLPLMLLPLQLPSVDSVEYWRAPDKAGWLQSQSEVMKMWRKRWFVLKQGYLFRFLSPDVSGAFDNARSCILVLLRWRLLHLIHPPTSYQNDTARLGHHIIPVRLLLLLLLLLLPLTHTESVKPRGVVDLSKVQDVKDGRSMTGKANTVQLQTASGGSVCYVCDTGGWVDRSYAC
jgi:hypothetical protein